MTQATPRVPRSGYDQTSGLAYFPRMLDKARAMAKGELREDFRANLGIKLDGRMCDFLRVSYEDVRAQLLAGSSDEAVLEWCQKNGRALSDSDITVWTNFVTKFGWKDDASERLETLKVENGLVGRTDIVTFCHFYDVDEGRAK